MESNSNTDDFIGGDGKSYPPLTQDACKAQVLAALTESKDIFRDIRFKKRPSYNFWKEAVQLILRSDS